MLQAVVKIQGHQYLVSEGKRFQVSKLSKLEKDQTVELKDVFLACLVWKPEISFPR